MLCVHLGPGRLGLGLVLDTVLSLADLEVCLIGASDRSHEEVVEYEIAFIGETGDPQARRVTWAGNPAVVTDLDEPVLDRLRSDEPVLITRSLAHQASDREGLLRDILAQRPARAETVVLACENDPDPMYAAVTDEYPRVHYCACVMDRVVNWNDPCRHADGRRRVIAHPLGQWVIWHPKPDESEVIKRLRGAPYVVVVEHEDLLAGYRKRRQWAVNGVRLVMALSTRLPGTDALPPENQPYDELQESVRPLMAIVLEAIAREHPELPPDNEFVAERMRVFRETPNSAVRILEKRLVRADLRALMQHVDACIGEAAREAQRLRISCEQFEGVVDLLLETLKDRTAYFDYPVWANLDPYVDAEVVRQFQDVISEWMDPTRALRAYNRLNHLLSTHRSA